MTSTATPHTAGYDAPLAVDHHVGPLFADLDRELAATRVMLAAVPDDRGDWAPHARSMSLATLASHIAEASAHVMWSLRMGDQVLLRVPRHALVRDWGISHLVHHRAQLGVYLRLLDVYVPGVYGPSADDVAAMRT